MRLTTSAKASPTASIAAVLLLGASPSGQASSTGPRSMTTAAARANVLAARPVMAMIGTRGLGQRRQQADDFVGLAALREHEHDVIAMHAAQVAMHRLGRMQEMAPRAGRGQRGHDLLSDQPRLADAGHDRAAPAMEEAIHGPAELLVQPPRNLGDRPAFGLHDLAGKAQLLEGGPAVRGPRRLGCS